MSDKGVLLFRVSPLRRVKRDRGSCKKGGMNNKRGAYDGKQNP